MQCLGKGITSPSHYSCHASMNAVFFVLSLQMLLLLQIVENVILELNGIKLIWAVRRAVYDS